MDKQLLLEWLKETMVAHMTNGDINHQEAIEQVIRVVENGAFDLEMNSQDCDWCGEPADESGLCYERISSSWCKTISRNR